MERPNIRESNVKPMRFKDDVLYAASHFMRAGIITYPGYHKTIQIVNFESEWLDCNEQYTAYAYAELTLRYNNVTYVLEVCAVYATVSEHKHSRLWFPAWVFIDTANQHIYDMITELNPNFNVRLVEKTEQEEEVTHVVQRRMSLPNAERAL